MNSFVAVAALVVVLWISYAFLTRRYGLKAALARAGTAATVDSPKTPAVVDASGKPILVAFGDRRGVDYKSLGINKSSLLFVKAVGLSAKHRKIFDGDICACDTSKTTPDADKMIVVRIKDSNSPDNGGYKIRQFVGFLPGGKFETKTYASEDGEDEPVESRHIHDGDQLVGTIVCTVLH